MKWKQGRDGRALIIAEVVLICLGSLAYWKLESTQRSVKTRANPLEEVEIGTVCGAGWDDRSEQVLVGLCEFARIQVYVRSGRFLYAWQIPGTVDPFEFKQVSDDVYRILVYRGDRKMFFDSRGQPIVRPSTREEQRGRRNPSGARSGAEVVVRNGLLRSSVELREYGRTVTKVQTSLRSLAFRLPFPAVLYPVLAVACEFLRRRLRRDSSSTTR